MNQNYVKEHRNEYAMLGAPKNVFTSFSPPLFKLLNFVSFVYNFLLFRSASLFLI